jgi:hypothetical protein
MNPSTPEAALQEIVLGLETLKAQAEAADQPLLAFMIAMAIVEARSQTGLGAAGGGTQ